MYSLDCVLLVYESVLAEPRLAASVLGLSTELIVWQGQAAALAAANLRGERHRAYAEQSIERKNSPL